MNKITEKEILNNLAASTKLPSHSWVNQTRSNLKQYAQTSVTESSGKRISLHRIFKFLSFSSMQKVNTRFMFLALTISILAVGIFTGTYVYINNRSTVQTSPVYLSEAEKNEFLANVIKNNPKNSLSKVGFETQTGDSTAQSNTLSTESLNSARISTHIGSTSNYKYIYTRDEIIGGEGFQKCPTIAQYDDYYGQGIISETYDYSENDTSFKQKWSTRNLEGELLNYYLALHSKGKAEMYTYYGGKYALKTTEIYPIYDEELMIGDEDFQTSLLESSIAEEIELTDQQLIEQFFGPDTKIVEKVIKDGKELYAIEYQFEALCNDDAQLMNIATETPNNELSTMDTIITRDFYDIKTFLLEESHMYFKTVAEDTLITKTKKTVVQSNDSFDKVSSNFIFDLDVPIKEETIDFTIDRTVEIYTKEADIITNHLKSNPVDLLYVSNSKLSSLSVPSINNEIMQLNQVRSNNHLKDRDFYPEGKIGDDMLKAFTEQIDMFTSPIALASLTFENESNMVINIYEKSKVSIDDIRETYIGNITTNPYATYTSEKQNVIINNKPVSATIDSILYNYPEVDPSINYPGLDEETIKYYFPQSEENFPERHIFIEFDDNIYHIMWFHESVYQQVISGEVIFTIKDSAAYLKEIRSDLLESYQRLHNQQMPIEPLENDSAEQTPQL